MTSEFEEVVDRCQRMLYTYARRLVGDPRTAEDVLQEAYLRLWRHWAEIDQRRVSGWLIRVTRNLCYDALRERRSSARWLVAGAAGAVDSAPEPAPGPVEQLEAADFRRQLRAAMDELDDPLRSVLVLREIVGLKYREIAEALELPLNSVRVYVHRGRRRIRHRLAEQESAEEVADAM
jgi:RNA polymerase sigma-70 factor (ECF subfamily)